MIDERLRMVSTEVVNGCHGDVGTDHAQLPLYLLNHKLVKKVVATEKSEGPMLVARQALWGREADVRLGDGLQPFQPGELQSLSLCGMGGSLIVEILEAHPGGIPDRAVVQANRDSWKVRKWALSTGFHLLKEQMAQGHWVYEILTFQRVPGEDPAYQQVPTELALHFGPRLLKQKHPLLLSELQRKLGYLKPHSRNQERNRIVDAMNFLDSR